MSDRYVTGLPLVDPDHIDTSPWSLGVKAARETFTAEGVAYLVLEAMDGREVAWAPLGSAKPYPDGEGTRWRIRATNLPEDYA